MEIVVHPQPLLGAHIQAPLPGTILYPTKDSAWHPVVSSIPPMATEVPKESIIANTDFTTTSLIAKRRLSSKKRKKLEQQSSGDSAMDVSTQSPTDSSNSCSPAVTSTTFTPPADAQSEPVQRFPSQTEYKPIAIPTTRTNGFTAASTRGMLHQHTHHIAPPPPHSHGVQLQPMGGGQYIPVCAGTSCYPVVPTTSVGMMPKHFVNPVLNHLQRELNFRFLQEQRLQPAAFNAPYNTSIASQMPHPQPVAEKGSETMGNGNSSEFKWCRAHVIIAKQIQEHQKQSKVVAPQPPKDGTHTQSHPQQVALMQMYNLQPNAALPGYMAMPYSLQEIQMRMQSFMQPTASAGGPPLVTNTGIPLVKHITRAPNQMGQDSNSNLQMVNSVHHVQAPFPHSVPIAALAPSDYVIHGAPESWIAPVPVFGSCIVNPFQPGIMTTSWVK